MTSSIVSSLIKSAGQSQYQNLAGGLNKQLDATGRFPPVSLVIKPLAGGADITIDQFLSYSFNSSITVPVDSFSFSAVAPDDPLPFNQRVKAGDIVVLYANNRPIATGIIDQPEVETDSEFGEKVSLSGRDLLGQYEDQSAITVDDKPIWANNYTVSQVLKLLNANTRIGNDFILRDAPSKAYLFATEPGESKLAALQRFLEPLNCLAWMNPAGKLIVGRPSMSQTSLGTLILSKQRRESNVLSMKVTRAPTQIPNIIVPIWSGQELVTDRVSPQQRMLNSAPDVSRLRKLGHRLSKTVVVSTPQGSAPQELSGINAVKVGSSNILQAYAKRELARANQKELIVQAVVPGHYNENGDPYQADQVYKIEYDRGDVNEKMYLFSVDYSFSESDGQKTSLTFCRLGTIVSDIRAP